MQQEKQELQLEKHQPGRLQDIAIPFTIPSYPL